MHNVILGMALGYGGLCQIIAGIEEWACGNTFGVSWLLLLLMLNHQRASTDGKLIGHGVLLLRWLLAFFRRWAYLVIEYLGECWPLSPVLYIPQFEVLASYDDPAMLDNALGLYLVAWAIVTFILLLACLRSSIALVGVFFFLDITFWLLWVRYLIPIIDSCLTLEL